MKIKENGISNAIKYPEGINAENSAQNFDLKDIWSI